MGTSLGRKKTGFGKVVAVVLAVAVMLAAPVSADARTKIKSKAKKVVAPREASILVNSETGEVLAANAADEPRHPASLTKMMTLYITFEALDAGKLRLDQPLKVTSRAAHMPPSNLGLAAGSTILLRDAISALTTKSANDVAVVIAENLAGSEETFARWMTAKAGRLGMTRTNFRNASGLHHSQQVTTARDMAILSRALVRNFPKYYYFFSLPSFTYNRQTHINHNHLLGRYKGLDGIKTGFVRASGYNLAASAMRDGQRLVAVVMGGKSATARNSRVVSLLNQGFTKLRIPENYAAVSGASMAAASADADGEDMGEGDASTAADDVAPASASAGKWTVQVGTFSSNAGGQRALRLAYASLPQLLADSKQVVASVKTARRFLYRAQFSGLSANTAKAVCAVLPDCLVVQPQ